MSKLAVGIEGEWEAAHAALVEIGRDRAGLEFREGKCLLAARRAGVYSELGYGSFTEYVERVLGYAPATPFPDGIRKFVAWFREAYGQSD